MAQSPKWSETRFQCQIGNCYNHVRSFACWDDLIDHMLNDHMIVLEDNKLMHYNQALKNAGNRMRP